MNEEKEHREKMIDRQWGLLAAIAQGYCQNPEFACTAYQPLADMIVRTANAVKERILHDPRIKATEAIKIGDAIAEMNEDETSTIIEQDIANKGMAAIKARNLAKKNPDKMYVLFEQRMQVQETCHMTPFKAVQKPADQDEVVNVKIEPMKKGKKPKE